jgi:hypothetical protein
VSFYKSRVKRLEERRRQHRSGPGHFTSVVCVPSDVPDEEWETWVAGHPCGCGIVGCPERRIGILLPARGPTDEAWEAAADTTREN